MVTQGKNPGFEPSLMYSLLRALQIYLCIKALSVLGGGELKVVSSSRSSF